MKHHIKIHSIYGGVLILIIATVSVVGWWYTQEYTREVRVVAQQKTQIKDYEDMITSLRKQLEAHRQFIRVLRAQQNGRATSLTQMTSLVAQAAKNITDIKKLEEADRELLAKYSKIFFLNEHYTPKKLATIPSIYTAGKSLQLETKVLPFLTDMLTAMRQGGLAPRVSSAYRSFTYQKNLKSRDTITYGAGTANQFVADQGYSEHQLGTTVDLSSNALGGTLDGFEKTPEYTWLTQNAYRYGFILSYPKNNQYYAYESWHWRFVGTALARKLHQQNKYFYDMSQREIDTYRIKMFDRL